MLLDTCVLLWIAADQSKLSERGRDLVRQNGGNLYVSAIGPFEIGVKHYRVPWSCLFRRTNGSRRLWNTTASGTSRWIGESRRVLRPWRTSTVIRVIAPSWPHRSSPGFVF